MADDAMLGVEVVCARPDEQRIVRLTVPRGATVGDLLQQPNVRAHFPELSDATAVGVFGKVVPRETLLEAGDRVEIYRPLLADPKQARRRRAALKGPGRA